MRVLRTLVILGILAGAAGAVIGAAGAVSAWRQDVKRDSVARLIADGRFVSSRERAVLASVQTLPTSAERRAAAASFAPLASGQTRRLDRAVGLASGEPAARLIGAETQHARAVALVSHAFAEGTPPSTRVQLLTQARTLLKSSDGSMRAARSLLPTRPWPSSFLELLEVIALALVLAIGIWRLVQVARGLAGLRYAIENRREVERLQDAAHTDSLTGLGNHRMFYDHLAREIKRRSRTGSTFSLLAIDLDGLKRVNDERGHLAGDEFIKTVARAVRMEVERMGSLYRTGGDEFMVLLPNRRAWSALTIAQNIQRAATDATGGRALSVGITESANTESARVLIHQADVALYEAKRNMLLAVIYRPGLERVGGATDSAAPSANQRALAAALAHAIDAKDSGERNHCETVAELSVGIGARVGIPAASLERLRLAGLVHDVGKIGLPDVILQKPGALDSDERVELEQHVTIGHAILLAADLDTEAEWVLHHHERHDGTGYPAGLAGEEIPLASRVLAVADAFETMTGGRPYRTRLTVEAALAELQEHSGGQFDPDCVEAIADLLGQAGTPMQSYSSSGSRLT